MIKVITRSLSETQQLAGYIASFCQEGALLLLNGPLAAGKTTFTKGIGQALDIKQTINSPTFVLMKQYQGKQPLIHVDAYRLEGMNEDLGLLDFIDKNAILVIEWSKYYPPIQHPNTITIDITILNETTREFSIQANSELESRLQTWLP